MNQNVDSTNAATLLIRKKFIKDYAFLILGFVKRLDDIAKWYKEELKSDMIKQGRAERKYQSLQSRRRKGGKKESRLET